MITELAATLSFSAIQNNDKIGVIFFSDRIEKFIPPQKGKKHILHIIRELIGFEPEHRQTNISEALRYLTNAIKKRCTAFVLSDFMDKDFRDALLVSSNKHDVVGIQIYDQREEELPNAGLMVLKDAETEEEMWVDTSSKMVRNKYAENWRKHQQELKQLFARYGIDNVSVRTDGDYVKALMALFQQRS